MNFTLCKQFLNKADLQKKTQKDSVFLINKWNTNTLLKN